MDDLQFMHAAMTDRTPLRALRQSAESRISRADGFTNFAAFSSRGPPRN